MRSLITLVFSFLLSVQVFSQETSIHNFFDNADAFFASYVDQGRIDYTAIKQSKSWENLMSYVMQADVESMDDNTLKAFRINAYNLLVIGEVLKSYPLFSVQEKSGFFDRNKVTVEGESMTLNDYEKKFILKEFSDPRLHFVLVCGALGCPPIISESYRPTKVDEQIQRQTELALSNTDFIRVDSEKAGLSQIFRWYAKDFGLSQKNILEYINSYREEPIPDSYQISYYDYDWSLNDTKVNVGGVDKSGNRYVVSAAIPKGGYEFKLFNNLYSQTQGSAATGGNRSTFYTALFTGLYGVTSRFNVGIAGRYRFVRNDGLPSSPLAAFTFEHSAQNRHGLTALGPQVRFAPFPALKNFSVQSTLTFPIGRELQGGVDKPFIDWNGAVFNNQFFNDFTLNNSLSLFTEIDLLIEGIGFDISEQAFMVSTPVTMILSYFPTKMATIYGLSSFSPIYNQPFEYFYQFGVGAKYQLTPQFEVELLSTYFQSRNLLLNDGRAATYNIGVRYSR